MAKARLAQSASMLLLGLLLASCGGAGTTGVASTPAPSPAPGPSPSPSPTPAPTNDDVANLRVNQTFSTQAAHLKGRFDLSAGTTTTSTPSNGSLTITYNAASGAYSLSTPSRSASFTPADAQSSNFSGETRYKTSAGGKSEYLTRVVTGYDTNQPTHSVALGYWQSNTISGTTQDTDFDVFVYGFPTPVADIPRSGSAAYQAQLFGFATPAGAQPLSFSGKGTMVFDFGLANFQIDTGVTEYLLVNGDTLSSPRFRATGAISSTGSLSGTFYFEHPRDTMSGTLAGAFYGPNAQEAGGTFSGTGLPGSSVVGAFTGVKGGSIPQSLELANLGPNTLLFGFGSRMRTVRPFDPSIMGSTATYLSSAGLNYKFGGDEYGVPGTSQARFTAGDHTSSTGSFDVYENQDSTGDKLTLSILKPTGNGKIELTYATLAEFDFVFGEQPDNEVVDRSFMSVGLVTPSGTLNNRTGSATYSGIALGAAANADASRTFSVSGTSKFNINFSNQSYGGSLQLSGVDRNNGSTLNFGRFDLMAGEGFDQESFGTGVAEGSSSAGLIQLRFYGPTAEELGGAFELFTTGGYSIVGATVAAQN